MSGVTLGVLALVSYGVAAGEPDSASTVDRQALEDAWWTGPIVAAGAATLPRGRVLIEPYVFDVIRTARYDRDGERQSTSRTHGYRSLTYLLYGVTDELTAGLIPVFGLNDSGERSSAMQLGDLTVHAQYRLSQFREGGWIPTTSVVVQQSLPIGKYDRLGTHPGNALGSGAYTTTVALRSQYYLWMPNGRILRTRLHVAYAAADDVSVEGASVYGTSSGFRGRAEPGDVVTVNSSWEYSVTRNWVLALDFVYQHDDSTRLTGFTADALPGARERVDRTSDSAWRFGVAPAIEYNWSGSVGVIVGARWFAAGRNTNATLTPIAALNLLF